MINKKIKTETSLILTPDDIQNSIYLRKQPMFFKSQKNSPTNSLYIRSEKDTSTDEDMNRLNQCLNYEKDRNEALASEKSILTNQLHVVNVLTNELQIERNKLMREFRKINKRCSKAQAQKIKFIEENGILKSKISCLKGTIEIQQQQIYNLNYQNRKLIDEANFQKQMNSQIKKYNIILSAQFQNIIKNYSETIKDLEKTTPNMEVVDKINFKAQQMKTQIQLLEIQIQGLQLKERSTSRIKNQIFNYSQDLENKNLILKNQLTKLKEQNQLNNSFQFQNFRIKVGRLQQELKIVRFQRDQTINSLKQDIIQGKKENLKLIDQIQLTNGMNRPQIHTNTEYLSKMIKENFTESQIIKDSIVQKNEQIEKLKEQLIEEKNSLNNKNSEIQRLSFLMKHEKTQKDLNITNKIDQITQENSRLGRKLQELSQKHKQLRNEIIEKDKIIMNLVQRSKLKN